MGKKKTNNVNQNAVNNNQSNNKIINTTDNNVTNNIQQNDLGNYDVNVTYKGPIIPIPTNEYLNLINENDKLRKEIFRLTNNEQILHSYITDKDNIINELREENKQLKDNLESLKKQVEKNEQEYNALNNKYDKLEIDHKELNNKYDKLEIDHKELNNKYNKLEIDHKELNNKYDKLEIDNKELNNKYSELEIKYDKLEIKYTDIVNENKIKSALSKLNDCDKLANDKFKEEYRNYFDLDDYDNNIPNLGQFVDKPPLETKNKKKYDFWKDFCKKYPNSDNKEFRKIYLRISKDRVEYGAHYKVHDIDENDFDELMKIALSDIYCKNKKLCDDYKTWLYKF
jgi:chromosome segregation ATPase